MKTRMQTPHFPTGAGLLATLFAATLILPLTAQAGMGRGGPPSPDRCIARHAEKLGVDAATVAQIEGLAAAAQEEAKPLRDALRAAREQMRTLLDVDQPDEAAVLAQSDKVSAALAALHRHHLATLLKIRALLTPEQRAKLKGMCSPGGAGGPGGGMGPGGWMEPGDDGELPCGAGGPPNRASGKPCCGGGAPAGDGPPAAGAGRS